MATITIHQTRSTIKLQENLINSIASYNPAYIIYLDKDVFGLNKFSFCVCIGHQALDMADIEQSALANPALVFDSVEAAQAAALEAVQNIVDSCNSICDAIAQIFSGNIWTANDEAQAADIAADYELAEVAERIAVEEAAPAALPLHINVEINKRMAINAASLFDMQALAALARCMPINAEITAKNGDVYFLWGASEFPAYMAEDGSAEIWAFPNSRPCRWLSISLGDAPRPAFIPERYDEDAAAEFWREDAIPF